MLDHCCTGLWKNSVLLVILLCSCSTVAINTLTFPKFVFNTADNGYGDCYNLSYAFSTCATRHVVLNDCGGFCCLEQNNSTVPFMPLASAPTLRFCEGGIEDIYVGVVDQETGKELKTVYKAAAEVEEQPPSEVYVGCVFLDLFNILRETGNDTTHEHGAYGINAVSFPTPLHPNQIKRVNLTSDHYEIRFSDLFGGCHDRWMYKESTYEGPVGSYTPDSVALYCSSGACEVTIVDSNDKQWAYEEYVGVDYFYATESKCIIEGNVNNTIGTSPFSEDPMTEHSTCVQECSNADYTLALIHPDSCQCASYSALPASISLQTDCRPCSDEAPDSGFECGNDVPNRLVSVYAVPGADGDEDQQLGYSYVQCLAGSLSNNPATVLDDESLYYETEIRSDDPSECFRECDERRLDLALLGNYPNMSVSPFRCQCLSRYYKFRIQDLQSECLEFWCPRVKGPCVQTKFSTNVGSSEWYLYFYGALYCRGGSETCGHQQLMVENDKSGICEGLQGLRKVNPHLAESYIECVHDPQTDIWAWKGTTCEKDSEVLVTQENDVFCRSYKRSCSATDARNVVWEAPGDTNATKNCSEGFSEDTLTGIAFWYCNDTTGRFNTKEPDRSGCQEKWLADVEEQVEANEDAVSITEDILMNLNSSQESLTGGGLLSLAELMNQVIALQRDQITSRWGRSTSGKNLTFAANAYEILDVLFGSDVSWQEVAVDLERYGTSSNLFEQIDNIGAVSFLELSDGDSDDWCFLHQTQKSFDQIRLKVRLSRESHLSGSDDRFFYADDSVAVTVPDRFVASGTGCVDIVAATLRVNLAATNMLPAAPTAAAAANAAGKDNVAEGLLDTMVSVSAIPSVIATASHRTTGSSGINDDGKNNVVIEYDHTNRAEFRPVCVFWNYSSLSWSSEGCYYDRRLSTKGSTVCKCDHLTNFAIIFGADTNDDAISTMSIVLGALSCACLGMSIFVMHLLRRFRRERRYLVELNRNYSLLTGQLLFLTVVGVADNVNFESCAAITVITHYAWMVAFAWIALEGYLLFKAIVIVFPRGDDSKLLMYVFGYGVPFLVCATTFLTALAQGRLYYYVREDACWLEDPYVWAFMGPVTVVLVFNTGILIRGLVEAARMHAKQSRDRWFQVRRWLLNFVVLSYLLGTTWALGYFNNLHVTFQYLFVCLNASTGIFVLMYGVLLNKKTREASIQAIRSREMTTKFTKTSATSATEASKKLSLALQPSVLAAKMRKQSSRKSQSGTSHCQN